MSLRASLAYFLSRGVSGALAVASISLFARLLGPEGYARLALTVTMSAFVAGVLIQPLHQSLGRFLPRPGGAGIVPTLGRGLLLACVAAAPLALALEFAPDHWLPAGVPLLALLLGASQGVFDFGAQYCSSTLQARHYGRLYLLKAVLVPVLGVLAWRLGGGASGAAVAMALSFLVATLIAAREPWLRVLRGRIEARYLPELRRYALPLGTALLVGVLLQWSDRLILAANVPHASLGGYSAAGDFALQGFGLLFSALHLAWFPRLVAAWERSRAEAQGLLDRYVQLSACLLVPAALGLTLVAGDVVEVLLGPAYAADAARVMPLLVLAAALNGVRGYFSDLALHLTQAMRRQSAIVGVCAAASIGANLLLVPSFGILAAAWVAIASNLLGLGLSLAAGRGVLRLRLRRRDGVAILAGCGLLFVTVRLVPGGSALGLAARVASGVLVYAAAILASNAAGARDLLVARVRGWRV